MAPSGAGGFCSPAAAAAGVLTASGLASFSALSAAGGAAFGSSVEGSLSPSAFSLPAFSSPFALSAASAVPLLLSGFWSSELGFCGLVVEDGSSALTASVLVGASLAGAAAGADSVLAASEDSRSSDLYSPSSSFGVTTELSLSGCDGSEDSSFFGSSSDTFASDEVCGGNSVLGVDEAVVVVDGGAPEDCDMVVDELVGVEEDMVGCGGG